MEFGTGKMWESELLGYKQQQQQYLGFDKKGEKALHTRNNNNGSKDQF